ncbi:MAG: phospholipase D-like domain-containing protein [Gammaproteobacteria bacterium]
MNGKPADSASNFTPYFGGPDLPRGCLRDVLAQRVAAVPAGGEIDWVTYYFRDRRLAQDLLDARRRGVRVRVTLDAKPRTGHASERVVAMLSGPDGLGPDLRTVQHRPYPGSRRKPRLHEKLYCFSHPVPEALLGSFNPSGDDPEEQPDIIDEILDQDRGHNFLVAINDPQLVNGLLRHARHIHRGRHGLLERFDPAMNRRLSSGDTTIHFWPRILPNPYSHLLQRFGSGALVRVAASHIKGPGGVRDLVGLRRRGARVEVLAESTHRRVPPAIETTLLRAGVRLRRFEHPEGLPMHNKFVLVEDGNACRTLFGSCNWTSRSRWLNHEIGVITRNRALFETFSQRWDTMLGQFTIHD